MASINPSKGGWRSREAPVGGPRSHRPPGSSAPRSSPPTPSPSSPRPPFLSHHRQAQAMLTACLRVTCLLPPEREPHRARDPLVHSQKRPRCLDRCRGQRSSSAHPCGTFWKERCWVSWSQQGAQAAVAGGLRRERPSCCPGAVVDTWLGRGHSFHGLAHVARALGSPPDQGPRAARRAEVSGRSGRGASGRLGEPSRCWRCDGGLWRRGCAWPPAPL